MPEYTVTGDQALDALIRRQLAEIADVVRARLPQHQIEALVLGGGYGRGEGGARASKDGFVPYNDYDLVLIHRIENSRWLAQTLRTINAEQGARCGIHVDITPLKLASLPTLPQTLTWYELCQGHRVLFGDEHVLRKMGERKLSSVDPSEWGRLLFNRGSGLLFCIWALARKNSSLLADESFDAFATRQVAKAWLTLGDVHLASIGGYAASVVKRREAWLGLGSAAPDWSPRYLHAAEFKLSPQLERPHEELVQELAQLSALYSAELLRHRASERRPLVGLYATGTKLSPRRWALSNPLAYPRERLKQALAAELSGNVLERARLIGSPADYLNLWEQYA